MKKLYLIIGLLLASAIPAFGQAGAGNPLFGISNDGTRHIPSDWATHNNPGYGSTYTDSLGGLKVCQMTDSVADSLTYNLHYATQNPINSSDQYAFVTDTASAADWQIRATGFNGTTCGQVIVPVANMPTRNTHGEMVWDHTYSTAFPWYSDAVNPLKFFYTNGDQLMSGTITGLPGCAATHNCTVTTAVVHTFSAYAGGMASIIDSSDIQMACSSTCINEHLPMVGQATLGGHIDVFNYYFASDTISAVYTTTCSASVDAQNNSCIHKLTTNSVGVVIQFASSGWGTELGQWEWGTPFSSLGPQLDDGHSHTDGGADLSGNPIEMKEGPTPTSGPGVQSGNCPSSPNSGIIVQNPTSFTSPMTCLVDYDFLDVEVGYTGTSQNPWMVLSDESDASTAESFTNSACFAAPTSANWKPYQSEVVFARVDAANNLTKVYRMLWMYSRANECSGVSNFQAVPKGVGSQDRNVILFNSTMGYQSGTCGQGCINVYSAFAPTGTIFASPLAPTISQTWPQSGVVGLAVDIDGTNFGSTQGTSTVTFNGTTATATNWTSTVISVTVPAGATTGNIVVTTSSGSASIAFTVRPAPSLTPPTCGISGNAANIIPNATDWKNFTPPAVGSTYQDTIANMGWGPGCAVTRLTNSIATFGDTDSFNHYYALVEPMSEADTKILIGDQEQGPYEIVSGPALGLTPGTVIVPHANISPACGQSNTHGVATWDRYNDMVFYQTFNNTLQKVTVSSNSAGATLSCTTVHTFTEYSYLVNLMNEPRMTPDGWISMVGQNVQGSNFDMFLFNPATGAKTPTLSSSVIPCTADINAPNNSCVHGLESTVRDGLFISVAAVSESLIWESPWTSATQWPISGPHSTGHQEFGADFNGNDSNFNESDGGVGGCGGDQPAMQLLPAGTTVNCLFAADSHALGGWDISYLNWPNTAFVLYSTQSQSQNCAEYFPFLFGGATNTNYCDPSGTSWVYAYNDEILSIRTDANNSSSHIYRLTLSHSFDLTYAGTTFTADPRAAMSFDGRYVVFDNNSAWANGANNCVNTDSSPSAACADVYMIDLQQGGGSPAVSLSPTSLSFGNQNVSTTSAQQVVTLTNTGTATLTISSVALTTGTQFAFATPGSGSDCRTVGTVAASGTCNIAVTFTPTSVGAQSDTVSITDNAAGSPHTFGVSGTGIGFSPIVAPSAIAFVQNLEREIKKLSAGWVE